jgi:hypothetical protein
MQGKAAKRVGDREEKQAFAAEHRAYRAKRVDPVFSSLDMGKHAEQCNNEVIRACCSCGIEVSGDQHPLAIGTGGRGLQLQCLARVG